MEKKQDDGSNEIKYRGVKAMPFVIGNETFEKLGTIGTTSNLLVYLTTVFKMKSITATNFINVFNGTCNFGTLLGAFLSDAYFGRYKTLGFASVSSVIGMLALTLTAAITKLHPPQCKSDVNTECHGPTSWQLAFLLTSFGFLVVGAGGIRPCNLAFGADQFNPKTESGRKGVNSFFNWYYFTLTFAMMISLTAIVYVQSSVSWAIGLAIPSFLMFLSCIFFFAGSKIYVKIVPDHSPITRMAQVVVAAIKKRRLKLPDEPKMSMHNHIPSDSINSKLPYTNQLRFLNKASIITLDDEINLDGSASNPWGLCSIQQVEEVKCVVKVIPIWFSCVIYHIVLVQMHTYSIFQALQTDRSLTSHRNFKIPAASFPVFSMLSLTLWIPIYDRVMLPRARKVTKTEDGITILQKIGSGILLAIVTMIVSGLVEHKRKYIGTTQPTLGAEPRKGAISAMSSYWLVPQFTIAGISEGFTVIGQVEFYYKQFPENMRSFGGSFLFCGFAVASYLHSFLASVIVKITENATSNNWLPEDLNKGRLDYFYYMVAILELLNFVNFLVSAKWYKYKGEESKDLEVEINEV
ncbi:transporter [Lithospermum erythrorhizon]|uniref:Transporter n=1 Tax=Lithospermum erythrorhizon TaxID=34254 RepID=A0AAV3Q3N3_LITER